MGTARQGRLIIRIKTLEHFSLQVSRAQSKGALQELSARTTQAREFT
jgi:hypothetical protein